MMEKMQRGDGYTELVRLFNDFRVYQEPPVADGVHDYSRDTMREQERRLPEYRARLAGIDTAGWTVSQKVDYELVQAEMNGLAFDHRTLRPWERDPSFYSVIATDESDVPAREAPCMHGTLQLYACSFPLDEEMKVVFRDKIAAIPGILAHAKQVLAGDTKDMYLFGIRQKEHESRALLSLAKKLADVHPELVPLIEKAGTAAEDFLIWLKQRHGAMADSWDGIGVEEFDWSMKYVHLVPFSWEEQEAIILRELERSWATLKMEEHRNRALPELSLPATPEEMQARVDSAYPEYMEYLRSQEIFSVPEYMHLGGHPVRSITPEDKIDIFGHVEYRHQLPLRCHMIHWLEKQRELHNTHPIRKEPMLYNIWDSRAEGFATAFEETMLQTGMMDHVPRARELVYVLLAFRAARAMGGLKMHGRQWTLQEAIDYSVKGTPRNWLNADGGTILGDLGLYLRQPGYGTSYVVGKIQFERLIAERAMQLGDAFSVKGFFDEYFSKGMIPASLVRREMCSGE